MEAKPYSQQPELHANAPYRSALLTYPGNLRQALKDAMADPSKSLLGVASGIPSTFVTKLLASTKPDFIFLDVEHGMFNRLELYDAIHAAQHHSEGRTMVIVRVPKHDEISLSTALDAGASGIIFPHVETADEVRQLIKNTYYGPIGKRSFSPWTFTPGISDASLYPEDPFNLRTSNEHVCIFPQIESVKGVENVDEIAAVEGIHGLMFGSGDFSIDAGLITGDFFNKPPHPTLLAALGKFGAAAAKNNLPTMSFALNTEMVPMLLQSGYRLIATTDAWTLTKGIHGFLQGTRELANKFAADMNETPKAEAPNGEVIKETEGGISNKEPSNIEVKA